MIVYDCDTQNLFTLNTQLDRKILLKGYRGHDYVGRTIKFNNIVDQEHLILNNGSEITILTDFEKSQFYKKFVLKGLNDSSIVDFRIFDDDILVVLEEEGRITIYRIYYFDGKYEELKHLQLGLDEGEMTTSLAICPKNKYAAVTISLEDGFVQNWLVVLKIEVEDNEWQLVLEDIKQGHSKSEDSLFFALEIPYYKNNMPVIVGCEFGAKNRLCSYSFDGKKIEEFKEPYEKFLGCRNYRFKSCEGAIWIVDGEGMIRMIQMDEKASGCNLI